MNQFNTCLVKKIEPNATLPTRAHPSDAGLDLYSTSSCEVSVGGSACIQTGIAIAVPPGYVGMLADRSSLAKKGLKLAGGIIDSGYSGEVSVVLWNISEVPVEIKKYDRIAQLLLIPIATPEVEEVTQLRETLRACNGFGSSGR